MQRGVSLIELLISLTLSCLLLGMLMQFYLNSKQHYLSTQKKFAQNSDVQLVSQLLRDSIRSAGFTPCLSINYLTMQDRRNEQSALIAIETKGSGSNHLIVRRMSDDFFLITKQLDAKHLLIANKTLTPGEVVAITDCFHGEIQEIEAVKVISSGLLITLKKPLLFDYASPGYIGAWLEEQFFMQARKQSINKLFYKVSHAEQLTTAISSFAVKILKNKDYQEVVIKLGLEDRVISLNTRVRMP
ncbi:PilW family protein [Legionella beliardensis]|nr:prepilin-type N-terminal cleavage/methylation domain-containing protein [Legionella beliardensis]